jgi:hypothetical protein
MRGILKKKLSAIGLILFLFIQAQAQNVTLTAKISENSTMSIDGTSTIHDWTSTIEEVNGKLQVKRTILGKKNLKKGDQLENLTLSVPVKSIKSPRGTVMDNRTFEALKYEEHPNIIFNLDNAKVTEVLEDGSFKLLASGELTIAGATRPIELEATGKKHNNGFRFQGEKAFKMTEYEVKPPSAMFGQIQTGDEVKINFDLAFTE